MEILNVGPFELIFILVLMIILLGPQGMKRTIRQTGKWIRAVRQSSIWKEISSLTREAQDLPVRLAREAGYEEAMEEIRSSSSVSIDLHDVPAARPGEIRSPGASRLRPPQRRGKAETIRTDKVVEDNKEDTTPETPTTEP